MNIKNEINKVIRKIKKFPYEPDDYNYEPIHMLDHCLKYWCKSLSYIGDGSFRKVYRIDNLPLVIKFPIGDDDTLEVCIEHSQNEMDAVNRIKTDKSLAKLKKYLPKIYYYDEPNGIILMHEYKGIKADTYKRKACVKAVDEIESVWKSFDVYKNLHVDPKTQKVTIIDLGVLGRKTNWEQCDYTGS